MSYSSAIRVSILQDKIQSLLSSLSLFQHQVSSTLIAKYKMGITNEVPTTTIMVSSP